MELFAKTRASTRISTRKIVASEHLNPNGTLFGGYLMCWMDEVAFMCARRFSGHPTCVTANIDNITFKTPLKLGEHVYLCAHVNAAGKTSMQIEVEIAKEDEASGEQTYTNSAHLTFVCLDLNHKPIRVPGLVLETAEDHRKNKEAEFRQKVRKRLNRFLDSRLHKESVQESFRVARTSSPRIEKVLFTVRNILEKAEALL